MITFSIDEKEYGYPCFEIHGHADNHEATYNILGDELLQEGESELYSIRGWAPDAKQLIKYLEDKGLHYVS